MASPSSSSSNLAARAASSSAVTTTSTTVTNLSSSSASSSARLSSALKSRASSALLVATQPPESGRDYVGIARAIFNGGGTVFVAALAAVPFIPNEYFPLAIVPHLPNALKLRKYFPIISSAACFMGLNACADISRLFLQRKPVEAPPPGSGGPKPAEESTQEATYKRAFETIVVAAEVNGADLETQHGAVLEKLTQLKAAAQAPSENEQALVRAFAELAKTLQIEAGDLEVQKKAFLEKLTTLKADAEREKTAVDPAQTFKAALTAAHTSITTLNRSLLGANSPPSDGALGKEILPHHDFQNEELQGLWTKVDKALRQQITIKEQATQKEAREAQDWIGEIAGALNISGKIDPKMKTSIIEKLQTLTSNSATGEASTALLEKTTEALKAAHTSVTEANTSLLGTNPIPDEATLVAEILPQKNFENGELQGLWNQLDKALRQQRTIQDQIAQKERSDALEKLRAEHGQALSDLEGVKASIEQELATLKGQGLDTQVTELTAQLTQTRAAAAKKEQGLDAKIKKAEADLKKTEISLRQANAALRDSNSNLLSKQEEATALQAEISKLEKEAKQLNKDLKKWTDRYNNYKERLKENVGYITPFLEEILEGVRRKSYQQIEYTELPIGDIESTHDFYPIFEKIFDLIQNLKLLQQTSTPNTPTRSLASSAASSAPGSATNSFPASPTTQGEVLPRARRSKTPTRQGRSLHFGSSGQ